LSKFSKTLIVIPTLNEEKNIRKIAHKIILLKKNFLNILFIDDNSSDRSQLEIILLKKKYKKINYLFRKNKRGIGSAHKDGIKFAFRNKFDYCITIDADGTHDPKIIIKMLDLILKKSNNFDIINTNRFLKDNSLSDWPLLRKYITLLRFFLVKILLKTNLDSSGGFRLYNLNTVKFKHFFLSQDKNYFYLIESLFYFEKLKYKIYEFPIYLKYRNYGSSKMRFVHIFASLLKLIKLSFKNKNLRKNIKYC
jgi:dolichol-phosphate mannosyltransferase